MSKRKRLLLIGVAIVALIGAALYEHSTHVARGWLRGEAFYQGRPTSYWRKRCDEWIARFGRPEWAVNYVNQWIPGIEGHPPILTLDGDSLPSPMPPPRWRHGWS